MNNVFCTSGILLNEKNQTLILSRTQKKFLKTYYEFPGGKVENNENFYSALIRELSEEPTLIVSSDKDFIQLQKFDNVKQWSPLQKKFVVGDPVESLYDKTIRGDTGDGVPNILSSDDTFIIEGKRQTPITKKKLDLWRGKFPEEFCNESMLRNYHRNKTLVNLDETPKSICINIINQYQSQEVGDRSQLLNYFVDKKLKNLMEVIEEF